MIKIPLMSNILSILDICDRNWSPRCQFVIQASSVHIINGIWMARNHVKFRKDYKHRKQTLNQILIEVEFIGDITSKMDSSSIHEFTIIKTFNVKLHPPKAPKNIEVICKHFAGGWLKCNTYGSFSTDMASCEGLFRNSLGDFVFDFAEKFDCPSSIHAELFGVIKAVDYAYHFG